MTPAPAPDTTEIDASGWTHVLDFYRAVLDAVGAPDWHGRNVNALVDSMVFGGINEREPPYNIVIRHLSDPGIIEQVEWAREDLAVARADHRARRGSDVEVSIRLEGQALVR